MQFLSACVAALEKTLYVLHPSAIMPLSGSIPIIILVL